MVACGRAFDCHCDGIPAMSTLQALWQSMLFRIGAVGAAVAAVCCVTPIVAVALTALGLTVLLPWQDAVLLPALGLFLILAVVGAVRARRSN